MTTLREFTEKLTTVGRTLDARALLSRTNELVGVANAECQRRGYRTRFRATFAGKKIQVRPVASARDAEAATAVLSRVLHTGEHAFGQEITAEIERKLE